MLKNRTSGFTLLEVMVAVCIVALAMVAGSGVLTKSVAVKNQNRALFFARDAAKNAMELAILNMTDPDAEAAPIDQFIQKMQTQGLSVFVKKTPSKQFQQLIEIKVTVKSSEIDQPINLYHQVQKTHL